MLAKEATFTVIDFETTGVVESYPNEPWQIGMIRFEQGTVVADKRFEACLRVGERPFSSHAPGNHHKHRDEIARASTLHELWPEVSPWLTTRPLVAHNVSTEKAVLTKAAPLHRFGPWIDTLKLVRLAHPRLASHSLENLLDDLQLAERVQSLHPQGVVHEALYDAIGCAVLLEYLIALPGWENASVEALAQAHPKRFHDLVKARTRSQ